MLKSEIFVDKDERMIHLLPCQVSENPIEKDNLSAIAWSRRLDSAGPNKISCATVFCLLSSGHPGVSCLALSVH